MESTTATMTTMLMSTEWSPNVSNKSEMLGEETSEEHEARMTLKLIIIIAYLVLFFVGTIGNSLVIIMIVNVLSSMRSSAARLRKHSLSNTNHVFIYVLGLSIVDLLVILHLPFLVFDLIKGEWIFGVLMCKLYWFGESVNKLLSSFIMTVLSWDRFLAVCSPVSSIRMRSNSVAVWVLLFCTLLATVLLIPVIIEANVQKIDKMRSITLAESSPELKKSDEEGSTIHKCLFEADTLFNLYTFLIGFLIPALLITLFYAGVIYRLHKSSQRISLRVNKDHLGSQRRGDRVQKVTKRIICVVIFYYCCWTPHWALNLLAHFSLVQASWVTPFLSALFFIAHLLVCFNSAANPALYALINKELRHQHLLAISKKRASLSHVSYATGEAVEFVIKTTSNSFQSHRNSASYSNISSVDGQAESICSRFIASLMGIRSSVFSSQRRRSVPPVRSANRQFNKMQLHSATPSPRTSINELTTQNETAPALTPFDAFL